MKKHLAILALSVIVIACNGGKTNNNDSSVDDANVVNEDIENVEDEVVVADNNNYLTEEVEEEQLEEEETGYSAPISVKVVHEYQNMHYYRETYIFNILKNGKLTGSVKNEFKDANMGTGWEDRGTNDFTGKWSTSLISRGDGSQKVFAIDRSDRSTTYYMPDDCEYIWMCDYAYLACEDYDIDKAMKVTSVTKL